MFDDVILLISRDVTYVSFILSHACIFYYGVCEFIYKIYIYTVNKLSILCILKKSVNSISLISLDAFTYININETEENKHTSKCVLMWVNNCWYLMAGNRYHNMEFIRQLVVRSC